MKNEVRLAQALDEIVPVDLRAELDCRRERLILLARAAVQEARAMKLDRSSLIALLARQVIGL